MNKRDAKILSSVERRDRMTSGPKRPTREELGVRKSTGARITNRLIYSVKIIAYMLLAGLADSLFKTSFFTPNKIMLVAFIVWVTGTLRVIIRRKKSATPEPIEKGNFFLIFFRYVIGDVR